MSLSYLQVTFTVDPAPTHPPQQIASFDKSHVVMWRRVLVMLTLVSSFNSTSAVLTLANNDWSFRADVQSKRVHLSHSSEESGPIS